MPEELYGVPVGIVITLLVGQIEQWGLKGRWAGALAIIVATLLYTAYQVATIVPITWLLLLVAALKGFVWGCGIVAVHYGVWQPMRGK